MKTKAEHSLKTRPAQEAPLARAAPLTSKLWQAAFVRPFEDPTDWKKHMLTWLSYIFGLLLAYLGGMFLINGYLQQPVQLNQMQAVKGVVQEMAVSRRSPTYFVLKTAAGENQLFFGRSLRRSPLKQGEEVTVWSQPTLELPPHFYGLDAQEVRLERSGRYVIGYTNNLPWRIQIRNRHLAVSGLMLAIGLVLVVRPIRKHWKSSPFLPSSSN